MAPPVELPTLNFGSGHDLTGFVGSSPELGSALTAQSLLGILSLSLSLSLSAPLPLTCVCTYAHTHTLSK